MSCNQNQVTVYPLNLKSGCEAIKELYDKNMELSQKLLECSTNSGANTDTGTDTNTDNNSGVVDLSNTFTSLAGITITPLTDNKYQFSLDVAALEQMLPF